MAEAKQCDRCKNFFNKEDKYLECEMKRHEMNWELLPIKFDLCERCMKEFDKFLGVPSGNIRIKEVIEDEEE